MNFVSITPPKFDCEIFNDRGGKGGKSEYDVDYADKYLILGLSKGTVVFVHVESLEQIYARFSVHRQGIDHLWEIKQSKCLVSMCTELVLNIWGF